MSRPLASEAVALSLSRALDVDRTAIETSAETPADGLLLELVDAATGAAVADATVRAWSERCDPRLPPDMGARPSDAQGRVKLPTPNTAMFVRSSTAALYGEAYIRVGERAQRVELSPSRTLEAHVAHEDGVAAAGVLLELHVETRGATSVVAETLTDAAGYAQLHVRESDLADDSRELILTAPLQSSTPERVTVAFEALPMDPVELKVGASGALEVSLVDRDGALVESDDDVSVGLDRDGEPITLWRLDRGRLLIEQIAINRHWEVLLWPERHPATWSSVVGPTHPGELVTAKLVVHEELPRLRGRVLQPDGAPLASHNVPMRAVRDGMDAGFELEVSTDDEGRFEAHTRRPLPLELDFTLELRPTTTPELVALTRFPQAVVTDAGVRTTVFDLGDLRLVERDIPKLCAGVVVDAGGAPVQHARVQLRAQRTEVHDGLELHAWSDADGCFEFRSERRGSEFWLSASARLSETIEPQLVPRGDLDVRLVLTPLAQLRGALLLPDRARANALELQVQEWSDDGRLIGSQKTHLRLGATSYFEGVKAPGNYVAQLLFDSHVICETPRISVEPGEERQTPPLDARELLYVVDLSLVGADGRALTDGGLEWTDGERCEHVTAMFVDGSARLHSRAPRVDVLARVPGYRAERIRDVTDGDTLTLQRADSIAIQGPALGGDTERFQIRLELRRASEALVDSAWLDPATVTLDKHGRGAVALGGPGPYRVQEAVLLERATVATTWIAIPESLVVRVDGSDAPLNIPIAPEALAAALARLR